MIYDHILIRYGELSLKKTNRKQFINRVNSHIKSSLKGYNNITLEPCGLRFYIHLNGEDASSIVEKLRRIPGIYSFSLVTKCSSNMDEIKELAKKVLMIEDFENSTFKVETHRGEKSFPYTSIEISKMVGSFLFREIPGLKADVHNPDIVLNIDVRYEGTFIYTKTIMGLGGLPSGSLGKGLLMISGGIDSVVAGYLSIKKGLEIEAVHYASPPYTSDNALQKVVDLLETIVPYHYDAKINLHIVPFTEIQENIYKYVREDYCITIMRRMMYRIAEKICKRKKCLCIINGESVGQVASQTLESINVIEDVVKIPVIRPLAVFDKQDIIEIATKIKSYDISIRPYDDCCTVFVPRHPQIKPKIDEAVFEEDKISYDEMIDRAVENTEVVKINLFKHHSVIKDIDIL